MLGSKKCFQRPNCSPNKSTAISEPDQTNRHRFQRRPQAQWPTRDYLPGACRVQRQAAGPATRRATALGPLGRNPGTVSPPEACTAGDQVTRHTFPGRIPDRPGQAGAEGARRHPSKEPSRQTPERNWTLVPARGSRGRPPATQRVPRPLLALERGAPAQYDAGRSPAR